MGQFLGLLLSFFFISRFVLLYAPKLAVAGIYFSYYTEAHGIFMLHSFSMVSLLSPLALLTPQQKVAITPVTLFRILRIKHGCCTLDGINS